MLDRMLLRSNHKVSIHNREKLNSENFKTDVFEELQARPKIRSQKTKAREMNSKKQTKLKKQGFKSQGKQKQIDEIN